MEKVLIAIDGSENSMKAVEFAGRQLAVLDGLQITLLHILPYVPAPFWDDGHILSDEEKAERTRVIDLWFENQRRMFEPFFKKAAERLAGSGIAPEMIVTRTVSDSTDTADSIIEEARNGGYRIVVMGRCGHRKVQHFPLGSVADRVISRGAGLHLCIVD